MYIIGKPFLRTKFLLGQLNPVFSLEYDSPTLFRSISPEFQCLVSFSNVVIRDSNETGKKKSSINLIGGQNDITTFFLNAIR